MASGTTPANRITQEPLSNDLDVSIKVPGQPRHDGNKIENCGVTASEKIMLEIDHPCEVEIDIISHASKSVNASIAVTNAGASGRLNFSNTK